MRFGTENNNWRGGKSKTTHGYILVRVGKEHHLSDVRGYAYEHRIEAEKKMGRGLEPGEMVHHINGIKSDNRHENLMIVADMANHKYHHRERESGLRMPGEDNPIVLCLCGCGQEMVKYDSVGRPRSFVPGHNPQPSPTRDTIVSLLREHGSMGRTDLIAKSGKSKQAVAVALSKMKRSGTVCQQGHGIWALKQI